MSDDLKDRAWFVVQLFRECDAIQLPHRPTEEVLTGMIDRIEELEAALAAARRDALEEAAKVCQRISNTDLAATNPPYEEGYSDAADACFRAIRALIAQEEPTT